MTGRNHKFTKCALAAVLAAVMLLGQTAVLPVSAAETSGVPDSGLFDPLRVCRRADAVTFVFRAAALE